MVYLFIGGDELLKQQKIKKLREKLFSPKTESFNYELLYAKELSRNSLNEAIACLPQAAGKRLVVIKDISKIKDDIKELFIERMKRLPDYLVLILDTLKIDQRDNFITRAAGLSKVIYCKQTKDEDAFSLAGAIEMKSVSRALDILSDLFKKGEKAERILGGLRYKLTQDRGSTEAHSKTIALLLEADLKMKTGRLKPSFALEELVVRLCG